MASPDTDASRERWRWLAVLLAVVVVVAGATAPVAAQSSDGENGGLVSVNVSDRVPAAVGGAVQRMGDLALGVQALTPLSEPRPSKQADRIQTTINEHNQSWVTHGNDLLAREGAAAQDGTYVINLTITPEDGDAAGEPTTVYAVVKGDGQNFTDITVRDNWNSTINASRTMPADRASVLADDLEQYQQSYVAEEKLPPRRTLLKFASKYSAREVN
jgi:hypothetical protein